MQDPTKKRRGEDGVEEESTETAVAGDEAAENDEWTDGAVEETEEDF